VNKYLVIGSEGFIGKHLVEHLTKQGHEVAGIDIFDIADPEYLYFNSNKDIRTIEPFLSQHHFEVCINAAGNGNIAYALQFPAEDFIMNCSDVFYLLQLLKQHQPGIHYIHFSSAAVYGNPESLPVTEYASYKPISPYGWHKLMSEQICREYHELHGMAISIVRPFSVFGPGLKKQIIWDLYQKCSNCTTTIELWGTGKETRDFIFISDLAQAVNIISGHKPEELAIYNLGSGKGISIAEVAGLFTKKFNDAITVVFNNKVREGDPLYWCADISKIRALGYSPVTGIDKGIEEYIKWVKTLE
jgi:UDP-glucose 4-epimerase